jgi:hypothetical protein
MPIKLSYLLLNIYKFSTHSHDSKFQIAHKKDLPYIKILNFFKPHSSSFSLF